MDQGLGAYTWWGFSPALDIVQCRKELCPKKSQGDKTDHLNVLLVGSGDVRHVLTTLSKQYLKDSSTSFDFYIVESHLESYARFLMLMSVILQSDQSLGIQEKSELFLELYGNTLIRLQSATFLQNTSSEFVKMVTDFEYMAERLPSMDLDALKYKERDMLEAIFKFWRNKTDKSFDMEKCWDLRVRQLLGSRYDNCKGAFDWDYSMQLCDRGGDIIGSRIYQRWRKTGVAFEIRDGLYDVPNRSLCSGMVFNVDGDRHARRGYWGDIVVGPFLSHGVKCEDDSYFKKANKEYISDSEQISIHNLTSLVYELHHKKKYDSQPSGGGQGAQLGPVIEEIEEDDDNIAASPDNPAASLDGEQAAGNHTYLPLDGVKFHFLPLNSMTELPKKSKYQGVFDVVYMSNSTVHHLVPPLQQIFSPNALLILESAKYIVQLKKEQYVAFAEKVEAMARNVGCEPSKKINREKDDHMFFSFTGS